jgi:thiamine-phosphate pyrophosphorylase
MSALALSYYITSREYWAEGPPFASLRGKVRAAFQAGVSFVQVREKDLSAADLHALVADLAALRGGSATRLLVNSRADVAVAAGADGVHLPMPALPLASLRGRLPQLQIVGVSCHNEQEACEAAAAGADYLLVGPVFATPSKPGAAPLGIERFSRICAMTTAPVLALGGVSRRNAAECVAAGARGVAGIRLFQEAPDLRELVAAIGHL